MISVKDLEDKFVEFMSWRGFIKDDYPKQLIEFRNEYSRLSEKERQFRYERLDELCQACLMEKMSENN